MRLVDHVRLKPSTRSEIPARISAECGTFRLRKSGESVAFQSAIERGFVQLCDFANEVQHIAWEPFSIEFSDLVDGKTRTYTPDYLVETLTLDGKRHRYVVEVKEQSEADRIWESGANTAAARAHVAMMVWCREQPDCSFLLATDAKIAEKGVGNVRAISDRASYEPPKDLYDLIQSSELGGYPATLGSVIANSAKVGFARGEVISTVLRLCADDVIWFEITDEWSEATILYRGARRRIFQR